MFAEIALRLAPADWQLVWVGDGPATAAESLRAAGVTVTGWLNRDEVLVQLAQADVFLSTSLWEGMPVALIEAMAAGLCPVVSRCAGNVDAVDDGVTGLVFSTADQAVAMLVNLAHDNVQVRRMASAAQEVALHRFSMERFLDEFETLYSAAR